MAFGNFWRGGGRERFGSERDIRIAIASASVGGQRAATGAMTSATVGATTSHAKTGTAAKAMAAKAMVEAGKATAANAIAAKARERATAPSRDAAGAARNAIVTIPARDPAAASTTIAAAVCTAVVSNAVTDHPGAARMARQAATAANRAAGESPWGSQGQSTGQGIHRGRGPRNYKRSDERIREDVCDCLTEDAYIDASSIDVAVAEGEVVLTGTVFKREDKRRAEDIAECISGVKDVRNNLRVSSEQTGERTGLGQQGSQQGQQGQTGQSPRH